MIRATPFIIAVTFAISACQAWKVDNRPADQVIQRSRPNPVAITMNDRRWVVLRDAGIRNDSIVGTRITGNTRGQRRTALSLSGVTAVQTRRFSFLRTIALGAALFFVPTVYRLAVVD